MHLVVKNLKTRVDSEPFDLTVYDGERIGLLGAGNSGKRTILRILARLEKPISGQLYWNERDVAKRPRWLLSKWSHDIVMVWANPYALFRGEELIGSILGTSHQRPSLHQPASHLAQATKFSTATVGSLSALQRVRLALAYAEAQDAHVILLDDVFTALSPATWAMLLEETAEITNRKRALVIASQYTAPMAYVHKICVILNGSIVEQGTRDQILYEPQQPYTQWLIHRKSTKPVDVELWAHNCSRQAQMQLSV